MQRAHHHGWVFGVSRRILKDMSPSLSSRFHAAYEEETPLARKRRARAMARTLEGIFPEAYCELDHKNPLELSVATILSAQCTDERVNKVTPALFARYTTALDYAQADVEELEQLIFSTGFYRNKARSIIDMGQQVHARFDGEIPSTMKELITLPGFGRKTANVVLGNSFGVPGLTIDTHFSRLAQRWGWTQSTNPVVIEREVGELLEKKMWTQTSHRVIFHGRRVCHSRIAACGACVLAPKCPSYGKAGPLDPHDAAELVKGQERADLLQRVGLEDLA